MEFFKEIKIDLKDILGIIVSLITIVGALSQKVRNIVKWLWSKTMGPIIDRLTGREKTNKLINSLIESNANFQSQNLFALNGLSGKVELLQNQHANIFDEVKAIKAELTPNGGPSMRDSLNRMEGIQWLAINTSPVPTILTNAQGKCIKANRSFLNMTKRSIEQILGTGWTNSIALSDRDTVSTHLEKSVKEGVDFEMDFKMINTEGENFDVSCIIERNLDTKGNVLNYYGKFEIL